MKTRSVDSLSGVGARRLIRRTRALVRRGHRLEADLLVHLAAIDARQAYVARGYASLWAFCVGALGFSEDVAYARITVARLARRRPEVLEALRSGRVHLTGLRLLAPHLDGPQCEALLKEAAGRSKREIELIVARLAPKPDVSPSVRPWPSRGRTGRDAGSSGAAEEGRGAEAKTGKTSGADAAATPTADPVPPADAGVETADSPPATDPVGGAGGLPAEGGVPDARPTPAPRPRVDPLSPGRYKVQFTADEALYAKLREAQDLLSHQVSPGDLAGLFDRALTLLIAETKKRRFAVGRKPRRPGRKANAGAAVQAADGAAARANAGAAARAAGSPSAGTRGARPEPVQRPNPSRQPFQGPHQASHGPGPAGSDGASLLDFPPFPKELEAEPRRRTAVSRHVPDHIKREVFLRDGERCAFVADDGRRCDERRFLELHHLDGFALTCEHRVERIELRCRAHNQYEAEVMFGRDFMELRRRGTRPGTCRGREADARRGPAGRGGEGGGADAEGGRIEAEGDSIGAEDTGIDAERGTTAAEDTGIEADEPGPGLWPESG